MSPQTPPITIRTARTSDAAILLNMVRALATYEGLPDDFVFTEEVIHARLLRDNSPAKALLAETNGTPVGFLIYYAMETFFAVRWLVMEAMYVDPAMRNLGIGKHLMRALAAKALESGCSRIEWSVMGWNKIAIDFYHHIGANPCTDWHIYRMNTEAMAALTAPHET